MLFFGTLSVALFYLDKLHGYPWVSVRLGVVVGAVWCKNLAIRYAELVFVCVVGSSALKLLA